MLRCTADRIAELQPHVPQSDAVPCFGPIIGPSHVAPEYRTLDADTLGSVRITETGEAGSVPEIAVENSLDTLLFLMDGQELVGAKQNRILNTDVLVPARTTLKIPVSCVEAGRWRYNNAATFTPGRTASHRIRSGKQLRVHESLRNRGRHDADQSAVWQEVNESLVAARASSPTSALHDAYEARRKPLMELRSRLHLPDDAVGLAVFYGNRFQGLDVFDKSSTMHYFWECLVDSYAIEWLGAQHKTEHPDNSAVESAVRDIFAHASTGDWEVFASPGTGNDLRLTQNGLAGSMLVWESRTVVHLQLFPTSGADTARGESRRLRPPVHRRYGRRSAPPPTR